MKNFAIVMLVMLTGCAAAVKLPGTKDAQTEQVRLLTHAIEKQADALVAIANKTAPTPEPTPAPTPEPEKSKDSKDSNGYEHFGEEPVTVKAASRRIK